MSNLSQRITDLSPEQRALLARRLQQQAAQNQRPPLQRLDRATPLFPLSFAQERYWFLHQWDPTSPLYTIAYAIRLTGALDYAAWQRSTDAVVARHEALRTTFTLVDGVPLQRIGPPQSVPMELVDLRAVPEAARDQRVVELAQAAVQAPFDLEHGPLLRMLLLRVADEAHVLVFVVHHIIFDGWSAGVLMGEMTACLAALAAGHPLESALPPLPAQYVDFAAWQRDWVRGAVLERQLAYWKQQLAGPLPVLDLPTDRPYPSHDAPAGARENLTLDAALVAQLGQVVQRENVTLFMLLLSAWYVVLHRYSRQEDILVGTPIANRVLAETEPLIGSLASTLVLRAQIDSAQPFNALLQQVRQMTLAAYEHQDAPFALVVEALQPERNLHHAPLFQVMFVLQNDALNTLAPGGIATEPLHLHTGTAKFALTLEAQHYGQELRLALEYKTALFDAASIQRMLAHYQTLLRSIVADAATPVGRLALLAADERARLLAPPAHTFPSGECVHERFTAQALMYPAAPALTFEGQTLNYGELNVRANQLAHFLQQRGVGPDTLVGLYCATGFELVIGILGILKAGGAYLPIDINYPQERVAYMLDDAGVGVLVTWQAPALALPAQVAVVDLERDGPRIAAAPSTMPLCAAGLDNLAYVIYTSGSTGQPKGALITHANVSRLFSATEHWFDFNNQDVWTLFHSCAFDFSVWELWGALAYGGRLVLVPFMVSRAPAAFYELLCAEGVTVLNQTPSAFRQLIQAEPEVLAPAPLQLRYVIFGGEALNLASLQPWFERHGDQQPQLVNMYGITETTVHVTYRPLTYADALAAEGSLIGQPIPDLALYVLDAQLQPVPPGVPGELFVGGAGLAQGYLKRPALTAERFLEAPFAAEGLGRLYRTGDLVRFRADGELEYLGRIDTQVKIRGFRIELGEIESALVQHPAVQAAVVTVDASDDNQRLVAYLVVEGERAPSFSVLRRHLKKTLPDYMLPAAYIVLDAIPLTGNGKVDYRALPRQLASPATLTGELGATAPSSPIEGLIAEIWAATLGVSGVGREANFFELGGHSLLATQVLGRLTEQLQVQVSLRDFFAAPTVRGLAASVERARLDNQDAVAPPIVALPRAGTMPLSFAQQRMWFLHQMEPESAFYNVPVVLRITGALDARLLTECLRVIIQRHEILRSRIVVDPLGDSAMQQAAPLEAWELPLVEFAPADPESALLEYAAREVQRPFDLTQGLLRATLLRHGTEHMLVLTIHHSAFDEWSRGIFFQELATLYASASQGVDPATVLTPLTVQYADYAVWHRYWLQGALLERQLGYWKQQLAGPLAELALPTDYPRPPTQTFNGAHAQFALPAALYAQLLALARTADATLFMLLLAAWSTLLARYGEQEEVLVGTPIANRTQRETEPLIGFFANTLVLRANLRGNPSFLELLGRVRELALDAYANQEVPFDQLVSTLQPQRDSQRSPLFQTMLVLQNAMREQLTLPGCTVAPVAIENYGARFELSLVLYEQSDQITGWLEYNTDLFAPSTVERMLQQFTVLLQHIVADPQQAVQHIPLLSAAEQELLLAGWSDDSYDLD